MVYCSLDILLLVTLRMALNQTHQRGSKAQSSRRPSEPPGVFGGGAGEPVPPQNAEYRGCYCVFYLARALMLTFANVYESCTTLEVWDCAGEAAGEAWSCALRFC